MAIRLSEPLEAEIRAHAARDFPYECCGVLLGAVEREMLMTHHPEDADTCDMEVAPVEVKEVRRLQALPNVHEDGHERRFLIAPEEMFRLEREARAGGLKILGFYHSHPNHPARPSEYDRDWAWPWYSYIIVNSTEGETGDMTFWTLDEDRGAFQPERRVD